MQTKEYTIGTNKIYVVEVDSSKATHQNSLLLIHGSFGAGWMWKKYIEFFSKQDWHIYVLDLRGHGKSGGSVEGATMQDYVEDVRTVVSELNIDSPVVMGHSMGGLVAAMYVAQHDAKALVTLGASPTFEIIKEAKEVSYPSAYTPMDAGMPADPAEVMKALPDIPKEMLMSMKDMLGKESGVARSERKKGVSIVKEKLENVPTFWLGSELADSVGFGINADVARKYASYYDGDLQEIKGSTHPGILVGKHALDGAQTIQDWLEKVV